jgi:hypothetical protein
MDYQPYDDAREEDEQRGHVKRGSYVAQRIAKRVKADVTPDVVKKLAEIPANTSILVHYDDAKGLRGRLKGVLTVVDGRQTSAIKVWDDALHHEVLAIMGESSRVVRIETKPSTKWGDSLTKIERVS